MAHFASFNRVGSILHELRFVFDDEQLVLMLSVAGFVQFVMLPDVSMASMKYGFDDGGQSAGLFELQS
jgi:hypothetical protein